MRSLPRRLWILLLLAVVCSGTPVASRPAAAETSAVCVTRLNAVRARAGLPAVSTSPVLTRAAQRHADYRARSDGLGLPEASAHFQTPGRQLFSGRMPWDRTRAAGLRDGTWAKQGENVITGRGESTALAGVYGWLAAPYHRFPMLDANMRQVGCAASAAAASATHSAEVLNMLWPWGAAQAKLTAYPVPHQRGVARSFDRRSESPRPFAVAGGRYVIGSVVSLQASGQETTMRLVARPTLARAGRAVPVYVSTHWGDRYSAKDQLMPRNAVMLAATSLLAPGTTYTVTVRSKVQFRTGGAWYPFARTWSFTTA